MFIVGMRALSVSVSGWQILPHVSESHFILNPRERCHFFRGLECLQEDKASMLINSQGAGGGRRAMSYYTGGLTWTKLVISKT